MLAWTSQGYAQLAIFVLVLMGCGHGLSLVLHHIRKRHPERLASAWIHATSTWLVDGIAFLVAAHIQLDWLVSQGLTPDVRMIVAAADGAAYTLLILAMIWWGFRLLDETQRWGVDPTRSTDARHAVEIYPLINKLGKVLIVAIGLVIALAYYGVDVRSFLVSLGVMSLAVALAAQETLSNLVAGFALLMDRPFRVGDRVQLENGTRADVLEIGLRSTKFLTPEGRRLAVPNSTLGKEKVLNLTLPTDHAVVLFELLVPAATELPRMEATVRAAITSAISDETVLVEPRIDAIGLDDAGLRLRVMVTIADCRHETAAGDRIRRAVWEALHTSGIALASSTQTVRVIP